MKRLLKFIFFVPVIWAYSLQAQVAVELSKMNVLYIGLPNELNIVAEGVPHEDLRISASYACTIVDSNGIFYIWPVKRGDLLLYIQNKSGDTLAVKTLRVRSVPKPELKYGTLESGTHSRGVIMAQPGIYATLGEGFAYPGVKFHLDSCYVRLLTLESEIICRQSGTATHGKIRNNLNEEFYSLLVYDAFVSNNFSNEVRSVHPLLIRSRDAISDFDFYSGINKDSVSISLNQCMIIPHDSVTYFEGGKHYFIQSRQNEKMEIPDKVHLIDGDTLMSIHNGNYRFFSENGHLLEAGEIAYMPDSVWRRSVQGELERYHRDNAEDTLSLELKKTYYPIGFWHYYHLNGKLKANGEYKIDRIKRDNTMDDYGKGHSFLVIRVIRTGTWKFYDETGKLILEKEYP